MSRLRFVMHPDDEDEFGAEILADETVRLIDGPRWQSELPVVTRTLSDVVGSYCTIWSSADLQQLGSRYIESCDDWYCNTEYATIQFLRSEVSESIISEGRIALSTSYALDDFPGLNAKQVEIRFRVFRKFIKRRYRNSVVQWCNPTRPMTPAAKDRSANPSKPDVQLWVGPHALRWLQGDDRRRIKQDKTSFVEAMLTPDALLDIG